jgi:hypothetical protein
MGPIGPISLIGPIGPIILSLDRQETYGIIPGGKPGPFGSSGLLLFA